MRMHALVREIWRNAVSGTARTGTVFLIAAVLLLATLGAELSGVRGILERVAEFRDSGATTLVIAAPVAIDGQACDVIAELPGVVAAGARRKAAVPLLARALPGAPIANFEVTSGFLRVLEPSRGLGRGQTHGVFLAESAAGPLGLSPGKWMDTDSGMILVRDVFRYPADGRRGEMEYSGLSVSAATGRFDECWATAWPVQPELSSMLYTSVLPRIASAGEPPRVEQLNSRLGAESPAPELFDQRITRWAWAVALIGAAGISWFLIRLRRVELAAALHARVTRRDLRMILLGETLLWTIPLALIGMATTSGWAGLSSVEPAIALLLGGRIVCALVFGAFVGVLAAFASIRERHLYRYFAER